MIKILKLMVKSSVTVKCAEVLFLLQVSPVYKIPSVTKLKKPTDFVIAKDERKTPLFYVYHILIRLKFLQHVFLTFSEIFLLIDESHS